MTGPVHGGRIDTLGLDENNSPVIIEYKRTSNENVINQGLFYLDWLLDHQAEFALLAMKKLHLESDEVIDWSSPRVVCIAGDFNKYDGHAVQQMGRNIELMRYQRYGDDYLLLELVNPGTSSSAASTSAVGASRDKTVLEYLAKADDGLSQLFADVEAFAMSLGDDVVRKDLKNYVAFKRIKNFLCVEIHPQAGKVTLFVKVNPDGVQLVDGFTRDVRTIGHFGTGDLEITLTDHTMLDHTWPLIQASYDVS